MLKLPYDLQKSATESERELIELNALYDNELLEIMLILEREVLKLLNVAGSYESGYSVGDQTNLIRAISARKELIAFTNREVSDLPSEWTRHFDKVQEFIIKHIPDSGVPSAFTNIDGEMLNSVKKISTMEYYGKYVAEFKKDIIYELLIGGDFNKIVKNIQANLTQEDLIEQGDQLKYTNSFSAMAKRIGHDILMGIYAITHKTKAEQDGIERFFYFGTALTDSRSWCREHLMKIYTSDEIDNWNYKNWEGKIPGVNVWIARGGYNCRHHFQAVPNGLSEEDYGIT